MAVTAGSISGNRLRPAWKSSWWARREREESDDDLGKCGDCGASSAAFDIYCPQNHLLVLSGRRVLQQIAANVFRVGVGVLVLLAAAYATPLPLYLAVAFMGLLLLILPLRAFITSRVIVACGWLVAFGVAVGWFEGVLSSAELRAALSVTVIGLLCAATLTVFQQVRDLEPGAPQARSVIESPSTSPHPFVLGHDPSAASNAAKETLHRSELEVPAISSGMVAGVGLLLLAALLLSPSGSHVVAGHRGVGSGLLALGVLCLSGAVALAAVSGFLRGVRRAERDVDPPITPPAIRKPPAIPPITDPNRPPIDRSTATRRIAFAKQLSFVTWLFLVRVLRGIAHAINLCSRVVWRAAYLLLRTAIGIVNWIWVKVVQGLLALAAAAIEIALSLRRSVVSIGPPLERWSRSLLASTVTLVLGAAIAVYATSRFTTYLVSGGTVNAVPAILAALVAPFLAGAIWCAATNYPVSDVRGAIGRLLNTAGPSVYLTALAVAWGVGILGWLGLGAIHPGMLTFAGTLLVVAAAVYYAKDALVRRRAGPTVGTPDS